MSWHAETRNAFRDHRNGTIAFIAVLAIGTSASAAIEPTDGEEPGNTVRCAVIGGMTDTGFWEAITDRFTEEAGVKTVVVATGPKHAIAPVFQRGEADLITMHASDTIINLVADGFGVDPEPWLRNDLLLCQLALKTSQ